MSDFDRLIEEDLVDFLIDRGVPVAAGAKPQQLRRLAKTEFRSGFIWMWIGQKVGSVLLR